MGCRKVCVRARACVRVERERVRERLQIVFASLLASCSSARAPLARSDARTCPDPHHHHQHQDHQQQRISMTTALPAWCRNPATAACFPMTPRRPRRSWRWASWGWTRARRTRAETARCWSRARTRRSAAVSWANRDPASPGRGRRSATRSTDACRISSTMFWRDRADGRSFTTLTCESLHL